MLNIVVCMKPVPDPRHWSEISLDPVKKTLRREGIPIIINPSDKHALEEALRIKDKLGGHVTVVSMAPPFAMDALRETLAMGADDAVLLTDRLFAGADTLATAHVLAAAIRKSGQYDLVICGNQSLDGSTGQVGPEVAEILNIPHVTCVRSVTFVDDSKVRVECEIERGFMTLEAPLPLLAAVVSRINTIRHVPLARILYATERKIQVWTFNDLGIDRSLVGLEGSPTQVSNVFMPEIKRRREVIKGESEETAKLLLQRLYEMGALK